jgi:hypothetical protein
MLKSAEKPTWLKYHFNDRNPTLHEFPFLQSCTAAAVTSLNEWSLIATVGTKIKIYYINTASAGFEPSTIIQQLHK